MRFLIWTQSELSEWLINCQASIKIQFLEWLAHQNEFQSTLGNRMVPFYAPPQRRQRMTTSDSDILPKIEITL